MSLILHDGSALFASDICLISWGEFLSVKAYASDSVHLLVYLLFFRRVVSLRPWGLNLLLSNVTPLCGSRDYMPYKVTSAEKPPSLKLNPLFFTSQCGERVPQLWPYDDEITAIPHSVVWLTAQPTLLMWRYAVVKTINMNPSGSGRTRFVSFSQTWSSPACG